MARSMIDRKMRKVMGDTFGIVVCIVDIDL